MQTHAWTELRPHNGSQHSAFEELCCQLASREDAPAGTKFNRLGTPDGGVEGYHLLPNGEEWGWQAKFITSLNESQLKQMDDSVRRAIATHPNLTQLTICFPINLPDPRGKKGSAMTRWNSRVRKWTQWAIDKGMTVSFDKWDDFEIRSRLSHEAHRGRIYYWFQKECLTPDWFEQRSNEAIANAGRRYTPELNIDLAIAEYYEALGRTPLFTRPLRQAQGNLARGAETLRSPAPKDIDQDLLLSIALKADQLIQTLKTVDYTSPAPFPIEDLTQQCDTLLKQTEHLERSVWSLPSSHDKDQSRQLQNFQNSIDRFQLALRTTSKLLSSSVMAVAQSKRILLTGAAGSGKTHLAADVNIGRLKRGYPSVLLLGQHFDDSEPVGQMVDILRFSGSADELLGALDAAAEAANTHATILIDALNEGAGKTFWPRRLAGLLAAIKPYDRLSIGLSVRSTYIASTIPETLQTELPIVEHTGFAEKSHDAIVRFFRDYSIELPSAPLTVSEFANPLFLKLFCEGLNKRGLHTVPVGHEGIATIFTYFIDSVEESLKRGPATEEPPHRPLVTQYLAALSIAMSRHPEMWLGVDEAYDLSVEHAPTMKGNRALLHELIREGILARECIRTAAGTREVIRFAYDRLGDHQLASVFLTGKTENEVRALFSSEGTLGMLLSDHGVYFHRGLLEAAMIQVAEFYGSELLECLSWIDENYTYEVEQAFLQSIIWRRNDACTDSTWTAVRRLSNVRNADIINVLLVLSTRTQNMLNADFLHDLLMSKSLSNRDQTWTLSIADGLHETSVEWTLTTWATFYMDRCRSEHDSARLLAITLTWLCTSTNKTLRDRATKALSRVVELHPEIASSILSAFEECNDPYVLESLYSALYGASMRLQETIALDALSTAVSSHLEKSTLPVCILTRDAARGVIERAHLTGAKVGDETLQLVRPPYSSTCPRFLPSVSAYSAKAIYHDAMSHADRVEAHIFDQKAYDTISRFYGAPSIRDDFISSIRLPTEGALDPIERLENYTLGLNPVAQMALSTLIKIKQSRATLSPDFVGFRFPGLHHDSSKDMAVGLESAALSLLKNLLTRSELRVFGTFVEPFLNVQFSGFQTPKVTGRALLYRWITYRTLELGWTKTAFGESDGFQLFRMSRSTWEPRRELFAYKYRSIAFSEYLAMATDNYYLVNHWDRTLDVYDGTWQLHMRRIDPSIVFAGHLDDVESQDFSVNLDSNGIQGDDWLQSEADLPSICSMFLSHDSEWITLDWYPKWDEPMLPEDDRDSRSGYKLVRYWIHGYFVRSNDAEELSRFLKQQDFFDIRMPEGIIFSDVYLGEFFWSPAYRSFLQSAGVSPENGWSRGSGEFLPKEVFPSWCRYSQPESDRSFEGSVSTSIPSPWLAEAAKLRWSGEYSEWQDSSGAIVFRDQSLRTGGTPRLEVSRSFLESFLKEHDLELIWTFQCEKILMDHDYFPRRELSGSYRYRSGGNLEGSYTSKVDMRNEG